MSGDGERRATSEYLPDPAIDVVVNPQVGATDGRLIVGTFRREPAWIKCSERLPDALVDVLLVNDGQIWCGYMEGDGEWYAEGWGICNHVTHWMPLPTSPNPASTSS